MDGIRLVREAHQALAAKGVGLVSNQPTGTLANQRSRGQQSDVYAMPVEGDNWQPLQVIDPDSADFGLFFFLPDFDVPGDTTKVVR